MKIIYYLFLLLIISSCVSKTSINRKAVLDSLAQKINQKTGLNHGHTIIRLDLLELSQQQYSADYCSTSPLDKIFYDDQMENTEFSNYIKNIEKQINVKTRNQHILQQKTKQKLSAFQALAITLQTHNLIKKQHQKQLSLLTHQPQIALNDNLLSLNNQLQYIDSLPLKQPLSQYKITSKFGKRKDPFNKRITRHQGTDLMAIDNELVYATASGKVSIASHSTGYGNMVEIEHGHGFTTRYAHLAKIMVLMGSDVTTHHILGIQGATGRATNDHVHYEVRLDNIPINPEFFLNLAKNCNNHDRKI